jgi:predicted PhzF superfamily epimerase YddE/YHI9
MVLLHLVDTFAERPFTGNPAAVCLLDGPRSEEWMQQLAFELGYAETAYVLRTEQGFSLRWFTPVVEVALCGHATMASAHVLWSIGRAHGPIAFQTQSGVLNCERKGRLIYLDLPRITAVEAPPPIGLFAALGLRPVGGVKRADGDFLVEVPDEDIVRAAAPDMRNLAQVKMRGVAITAPSKNPEFDFVSRFFAPASGIDEDAVTGSTHCALAPLWAERLGKQSLRAQQLSKRGGTLTLEVQPERVRIGGHALTVFTGALAI